MAAIYPGYLNQGALSNTGPSEEEVKKNRAKQAEAEARLKGKPFSTLANPVLEKEKATLGDVPPSTHDGRTYADGQGNRGVLTTENYDPKKDGILVPDSTEDPGRAIQALSINQAIVPEKGQGTGVVPLPEPPNPRQTQIEMGDMQGKQVMFDMNKIPKPMDSNAFNMGLMSFGLNLLSGNSYADAFNAAGNHFNDAYGREKREAWAQDLSEQGYDAQDIQRWIDTGDNKDLTDPMEKAVKQQQFAMGQQNLNKAMYENSDEMRQYVLDKDKYQMEMDQTKLAQDTAFRNATLAISEQNANRANAEFAYRQQQDWNKEQAKGSGGGGAFSAGESQAYNHYTRAQSGMKNYEATVKETGGEISDGRMFGSKTLGSFADAKTIELALSGDPMQVQMARSLGNDKMVNTILAEKEWLSPVMRKDSGAAVSSNEWNNMGNIYFPRPGDSESKVAQKQQAREVVTLSMNPRATPELRQIVDMYSAGALEGLRLRDGQAYAKKDGQWFAVPMF